MRVDSSTVYHYLRRYIRVCYGYLLGGLFVAGQPHEKVARRSDHAVVAEVRAYDLQETLQAAFLFEEGDRCHLAAAAHTGQDLDAGPYRLGLVRMVHQD
eukprot:1181898-Prorocentrum_minimum.AAC.1